MLIMLVLNLIRINIEKGARFEEMEKKWSLILLIIAHLNLLTGLYQYFFGESGIALIKTYGMKDVMHFANLRFWVVEHITGMLIAIALITVSHSVCKKVADQEKRHKRMSTLYILALVIIIACIPWPFREGIGRMWFRGLY